MGLFEALFCLLMCIATGVVAWNLAVRRERGRQARYEEITRMTSEKKRKRGGVTLRRVKFKR